MQWKIAYAHHEQVHQNYCTVSALQKSPFAHLPASVPGCLEQDLMRAGVLEDLYFSTNTLKAQELEDVHVWYYSKFDIQNKNQYLRFEGIDTFADIYVNGQLVKSTDNMFLSYDIFADWIIGENEVVVHIKPTMLEARKFTPPAISYALRYNYAGLYVRKAGHMFGWDIMPRIVSAGLWKEVRLLEKKQDSIEQVYLLTHQIKNCADREKQAFLRCFIHTNLSSVFAQDYRVKVEGVCGDHRFCVEQRLWHTATKLFFDVPNCKLWWPKNAGEQNLYDVTVMLLYGETVCDTYRFAYGIRTVELDRTELTGPGRYRRFRRSGTTGPLPASTSRRWEPAYMR